MSEESFELQRVVDTVDGIDEPLQRFYREGDDGKWRLQVDDATGLKRSLESEKIRRAEAIKERERILKENKELLTRLAELEESSNGDQTPEADPETGEDPPPRRSTDDVAKLKAEKDRELKKWQSKLEETNKALEESRNKMARWQVQAAITRYADGAFETAMPDLYASSMEALARGSDGDVLTSDDGEPLFREGEDMLLTPKEFVESVLKAKKPHCFKAKSGVGASGSRASSDDVSGVRKKSDLKTTKEKVAFAAKYGWDQYHKLPA